MLKLTILLALVTLSLTQEDGESIQNKEDDNLITLNLSNQGITSLNEYDFTKYPLLEELDLSNNDIEYIKEDILIDNVHLKKLNLSGNKNLKFPEFSTLLISEIEELSLANCNIEQLPANIFDGLVNLKIIDLSENPLDEKGIEVSTLLAILSPKKVILPSIHESMIKEICEQLDITIGIKSQDYSDAIKCADVREGKWQNLPKEEASQEINLEEQEEENLPQAENEDDNIIVEIKRQASPEESVHNDDPAQAEGSEGEGLVIEENIEAQPDPSGLEENKPEGGEEEKIEPGLSAPEAEEENKEPEGVEENKIEPDPSAAEGEEENKIEPDPSAQEGEEENKDPEGPEETKIEPNPSAQEGQEENKEPDQAAPEGAEEQVEADPSPQEGQEGNPVAPEGAEENKIEPDPSPEENKPDEGATEDKTEPEINVPEGTAENQENLEPPAPEGEVENKDNLEVPENKDNPEPPQLEGEGDPQDKLEPPTAEGGADPQDKVEEKTPEVAAPDTIDGGGNPPDAVDGKRMLPGDENQEGDEPKQKGIGGAENNTAPRSAINTNAANPSDETKAGESSSKSSGAGSTVLVVLVCVVVVAGAAAFGYKFYKTRKYQAAQSVEPVERELKEIVVDKRLNGSSNPQNQIEAQPLMDRLANSVEIKEIDEINDKSDTTASGSNNNGPYVPTTTPIKPPHVNKDDGKAEI